MVEKKHLTNFILDLKVIVGESFTFLVDDNEGLFVVSGADLPLELDDLLDSILDELALGVHKLLALFGGLVEEAGIDFGLLVLHAHLK
jgi:hypothetical protein